MKVEIEGITVNKEIINGIPVIYIEPKDNNKKKMILFLGGLSSTKESLIDYLKDIAEQGFYAFSFDNFEHGERGNEKPREISTRVFSNIRKYGWRILGETVKNSLTVIDWAISNLNLSSEVRMGGISMGGDISISAAGIDKRIVRIAPIVATPNWLRPDMHVIGKPDTLLDPGEPDEISNSLFNEYNPMTHLDRYINCPLVYAVLGEHDTHISPKSFECFKQELSKISPEAAKNIDIEYIRGNKSDHIDVLKRNAEWWPNLLNWLIK